MLSYSLANEAYELMKGPPSQEVWHKFVAKLKADSWMQCWEWIGNKDKDGYGIFDIRSIRERIGRRSHRIMMHWMTGLVPDHLVIDHVVCSNPPCNNPLHLRVCTPRENDKHAMSTHCKRGHERTPENQHPAYKKYYGENVRACKACTRQRQTAWAAKNYEKNIDKMRKEARERQAKKLQDPVKRAANSAYQRERYAKMTPEEKHRRRYGANTG